MQVMMSALISIVLTTMSSQAQVGDLTARAAAEASRHYEKRDGSHRMAGTDEGGGYDVCPSAAAVTSIIDAGTVAPADVQDERMEEAKATLHCRQGSRLLTNIKVRRYVQTDGTAWYGGTGTEAGKLVNVLVWMN